MDPDLSFWEQLPGGPLGLLSCDNLLCATTFAINQAVLVPSSTLTTIVYYSYSFLITLPYEPLVSYPFFLNS